MGCLTLLILGFIILGGVVATGWYIYHKLETTNLISDAPADVRLEPPTDAEYSAAESALARLKNSTGEVTVPFTATDLNALLSRDPEFRDLRNRARIDIQNSTMTLTLSAPLGAGSGSGSWSGLEGRWFNGTVRLRGSYDAPVFQIDLQSVQGGEYEIPGFVLGRINSWLNWALNENPSHWDQGDYRDEVWQRIKTIRLEGDKLFITTKAQ